MQGEPYVSALTVLRDSQGILMASAMNVFTPGGSVAYDASLLTELKLAWVSQPSEACIYRQVAFELTIVQTGQKVLAFWNSRTSLQIGGQSYSFYVKDHIEPLVGCGGPGNWVLIRDGFVHRL